MGHLTEEGMKTKIVQILRKKREGHDVPLSFTVGQPAFWPGAPQAEVDAAPIVEKITSVKDAGKYAHSLRPSYIVHFVDSDTKRTIPAVEVFDAGYELVEEIDEPALPALTE